MPKLEALLQGYNAYHRDRRNRLTHAVGIPTVVLSLLVVLGWFRFNADPRLSAATVVYLGLGLYYLRLDVLFALIYLLLALPLLWGAERIAQMPFHTSCTWFVTLFVVGWAFQLLGHVFEKRRPALVDNITQVFTAPLFIVAELVFLCGMRRDLRQKMES